MTKPQYNLSSSKRLHEPERPKSFALSITLKRSLNAEVEAWVANGGAVTVVQVQDVRIKPDVPLNRRRGVSK